MKVKLQSKNYMYLLSNGSAGDHRVFVERQGIGRIDFLFPADSRDAILGENVIIDYGYVEVEDKHLRHIPAIVTLNNISTGKIHLIDSKLQQRGAKVVAYNKINGNLQFYVPHFSTYNIGDFLNEDDDEDEDDEGDLPSIDIQSSKKEEEEEENLFYEEEDEITETESDNEGYFDSGEGEYDDTSRK